MIKVYGIKTCGSVRNGLKFFKDQNIEVDFVDFKTTKIDLETVKKGSQKVDINTLFNSKGTKYKTMNLKELNLDEKAKKEYLSNEPMLVKRPVIEYGDNFIVAWDEEAYKKIFFYVFFKL